jgi:hypothetical protein
MSDAMLPNALAWANRGHAVFPLWWPVTYNGQTVCACGRLCDKPAKHPVARYAPDGCYSATTETGIVKLWWGLRVPEANLGVHCAGLIVVDIDPDDGGDESLAVLEREHGELPLTWRSLTGGGGQHIFFTCPDGVVVPNIAAKNEIKWGREPPLGPGIDIRTKGGYVVAPPSRHISGGVYAWSVDHHPANVKERAPAPAWLIERLRAHSTNRGKGHDPAQWAARKAEKFTQYRDAEIASLAGKLLRAVSLDPAFVATLVHDWNLCHCDPPLPEDEVQDIFNRICRAERRRLEADNA